MQLSQVYLDACVKKLGIEHIEINRDWLMTPKMYDWVCKHPEKLNDALHERYCAGGMIDVQYGEKHYAKPCPRCEQERRFLVLEKRMLAAGISPKYLEQDWHTIDMKVDKAFGYCRNYAQRLAEMREAGRSLFVHGAFGRGKSLCAVLIAKQAIQEAYSCLLVALGRACVDIRAGYNSWRDANAVKESDFIAELIKPDFLILDDLGAENATEHKTETRVLAHVLDGRNALGKPTIVTTNLSPSEFTMGRGAFKGYGARSFNRLQPYAQVEFTHRVNFRAESEAFALEDAQIAPAESFLQAA